MGTVIYLNGRFVAKEEATISVYDHGYLSGDGVFAGIRAYAQPKTYDSGCRNPRSLDGQFHLLPHYRTPDPLEDVFRQTEAGHDQFVSEKYHDQIAAILAQWSSSLLQNSHDLAPIGKAFSDNFSGTSMRPMKSRVVRSGGVLEISLSLIVRRRYSS